MIDFSSKITPARMQRTTANLQMALESDRGRIINSAAIRRLQQKTQVFPLERNAAVRSRLTHSLEVQQVGRFIVQRVFANLNYQQQKEYGLSGELSEGNIGVWLDVGTQNERKICSIGVKISKGITMHGLALNVNTDLSYFNHINPCGFTDKVVTSMKHELGKEINTDELINFIKKGLVKHFK